MPRWPPASGRVQIINFELGCLGTNAYLLLPEGRADAVLIDAPEEAWDAVKGTLIEHGRLLATLLLTHGHWDHMAGAAACQRAGARVYAHPADRAWIEKPDLQAGFVIPDVVLEPAKVDELLAQGQSLDVAGLHFEVRHVPGHAPGNVLFYLPAWKCAFPGDAIFSGSVGRADLPGGDWDQLERSIKEQIYTLPEETVLYPGHGPPTTVGTERRTNSFVRG